MMQSTIRRVPETRPCPPATSLWRRPWANREPTLRQCPNKRLRHLRSAHVAGGEVELSYTMTPNRHSLEIVVTIPLIFREDNPTPIRNLGQPHFVVFPSLEVRFMALKTNVIERQSIRYRLAVLQILIQEEDEIIKLQLLLFPSG